MTIVSLFTCLALYAAGLLTRLTCLRVVTRPWIPVTYITVLVRVDLPGRNVYAFPHDGKVK